jgi:hypothetical protein
MLPAILIASMAFFFQGGLLLGRNLELVLYVVGAGTAGIAFLVWITGVVLIFAGLEHGEVTTTSVERR